MSFELSAIFQQPITHFWIEGNDVIAGDWHINLYPL